MWNVHRWLCDLGSLSFHLSSLKAGSTLKMNESQRSGWAIMLMIDVKFSFACWIAPLRGNHANGWVALVNGDIVAALIEIILPCSFADNSHVDKVLVLCLCLDICTMDKFAETVWTLPKAWKPIGWTYQKVKGIVPICRHNFSRFRWIRWGDRTVWSCHLKSVDSNIKLLPSPIIKIVLHRKHIKTLNMPDRLTETTLLAAFRLH